VAAAAARITWTAVLMSNGMERASASAQKQLKKVGNTLIFDTMLSSIKGGRRYSKYKWRSYYSCPS
jgi:hypothetical protein